MDECYIWIMELLIFLLICYLTNLILSALQLINRGGYGYDGILSMLKDNPLLFEINEKKCNLYISDIEYKKKFAKIKTIFNVIYNSGLIIYNTIRLKPVKKSCLIDIFFHIIIHLGFLGELVLVSMSLNYYNKTEYDSENFEKCNRLNDTFLISEEIWDEANTISKWVIKSDKAILSLLCIYFFPLFVNSVMILCKINCGNNECIDTNFCWVCNYLGAGICLFFYCLYECFESIYKCFSSCCNSKCKCCSDCCSGIGNCCPGCCDKCGNCCAKCCGNDYASLKNENNNL